MARTATKPKTKSKKGVTLVPLGDRVVLKRADAEEVSAGGIVLPDSAKNKSQEGQVVSVGEGQILNDGTKVSLTVKKGDRVLFSSYAGEDIGLGDDEFLLMRESDILAVLG